MSTHNRSLIAAIISLLVSLSLAFVMALISFQSARADPGTIYVDQNAPGPSHDGLSWTTAYTNVQAALAVAAYGDQIWVAQGVYYPAPDATHLTTTFQMVPGVALYGGFAATETLRTERDWTANLTVLSGDLDRNDTTDLYGVITSTALISGTNAYHVISSNSSVTETTVLDGFVITAGDAQGSSPHDAGGGWYNLGSPTLANLIFSANRAMSGGGMYNQGGNPALTGVTFYANRSTVDTGESGGGGMFSLNGNPTLQNVLFDGNTTERYGGGLYNNGGGPTLTGVTFAKGFSYNGGGMYNRGSAPTLTDVTFRGNRVGTSSYGGGMFNTNGSPALTTVLFSGNTAFYGGGMYTTGSSNPTLNGVTFGGNRATSGSGGGLRNGTGSPMLVNSILWGNGSVQISGTGVNVTYSLVQGGYAGEGNLDADPLFVAPVNSSLAPTTAGDYRLRYASPAIDTGNNAVVTASTDLDGNPRPVDGSGDGNPVVDLGAYEYQQSGGCPPGGILYVNHAAGGANDGSSWDDAYTDLQEALTAARDCEVWVAQGVYYPAPDASDRSAAFLLRSDVQVYGGFAATETLRTERDWLANLTVLSGDLDGNDTTDPHGVVTGTNLISGTNAYHVVVSSGVTTTAALDGFILTAGQANASLNPYNLGGGLYNYNGNPTLDNLTFSANLALNGGGLYNVGGDPSLSNVTFYANRATATGGGMYSTNGNPILTHVTFYTNRAVSNGGGLYNQGGSPTLTGVTFHTNQSAYGGGMYNTNGSPTLLDVVFRGNWTDPQHGGGLYNTNGSPTLINTLFSGNTANYGGGMYTQSGNPTLNGVTFGGNRATDTFGGGGLYHGSGNSTLVNSVLWGNGSVQIAGSVNITHSLVQGGYPGEGSLDADPLFVAPVDSSLAPTTAGDYRLRYASPAIDIGNNAVVTAGTDLDGNPRTVDGSGDGNPVVDPGVYEYQDGGYCPPEGVLYVNHAATGDDNGSSWDDAYTDLQDALTAARDCEVWVAQGVYYPAPDASDRSAAFLLRSGVQVYGGFAATETLRTQRDWLANLTILSGDLDRNDTTDPHGVVTDTDLISGTNAYHVVVSSGVTTTAALDGFILTAGQANASLNPYNLGGGLYNYNGNPTLDNLTFSANLALNGGGLYNAGGDPALSNVTFYANRAAASVSDGDSGGGGMFSLNGSPILQDVLFGGNTTGRFGGGLYVQGGSPTLTRVTFHTNQSAYYGGAMYNTNSSPDMTGVVFRGNWAGSSYYGGGMYNTSGNPALTNALFSGNTAAYGGGLYTIDGNPILNGVTFGGNRATDPGGSGGGGLYNFGSGSPVLVNSILWGNGSVQIAGSGVNVTCSLVQGGYPGDGNIDDDPIFIAPVDSANAPTTAGNYHLRYDSPAIETGNTLSVTAPTDLDGQPRAVGDAVDMGAYEHQAYTLTTSQAGEGGVSVTPDWPTYTYLDQVMVNADAEPGWAFTGWSGDAVGNDNPLTLTLTGHTAITATFNQEEFTLTVLRDPEEGGTVAVVPEKAMYRYGDVITLTASSNPGWTFEAWHGDVTGTTIEITHTITAETVVTAIFSQDAYTLTVLRDPEQGGTVTVIPEQTTYHYGDAITLTATANPGWSFEDWSGDVSGTVTQTIHIITGHTLVTATFSQDEYTLTVLREPEQGGTVTVVPAQAVYHYGDVITLTATSNPGWTFTAWSGDVTGNAPEITHTIIGDTVVTATFSQDAYTLTVLRAPEQGGTVAVVPEQAVYHYGDVITLTAIANPGWTFTAWSGDVSGSTPEITHTITGNTTVTATFSQNEYTLTINRSPEAGGTVTVTPDKTTYHYGDVITLTAIATPDWEFVRWSGDVTGTEAQITHSITGHTIVTATFTTANNAPVFTSTPVTVTVEGTPYVYNVTATDPDGDALIFSASQLPAWLLLTDHGNGTATLAGTPASANVGSNHQIVLRVTDSGGLSTEQYFTLTVRERFRIYLPLVAKIIP